MGKTKIHSSKWFAKIVVLLIGLHLIGNCFASPLQQTTAVAPKSETPPASGAAPATEMVRLKVVDLFTGMSLANHKVGYMMPIDERSSLSFMNHDSDSGKRPQTFWRGETDATGMVMIQVPELKYGGTMTSQGFIERLPDGSWIAREFPDQDVSVANALAALDSPVLYTRLFASFHLWSIIPPADAIQAPSISEADIQLLKANADKINKVFFSSVEELLTSGNKGIRTQLLGLSSMFLGLLKTEQNFAKDLPNAKPAFQPEIPRSVVNALLTNLQDEDADLKDVTLTALLVLPGKPTKATIQAIERRLKDLNPEAREFAEEVLKEWKTKPSR
jgi:hypothetical protein